MSKTSKIMWSIALIIILVLIGVVVFGIIKNATFNPENPVATIEVEKFGTIKVELYPDVAPESVSNFIALANKGFYNDLTFHRIMKDFMIQGGDVNGDGTGNAKLSNIKDVNEDEDKDYTIKGEFRNNGVNNKIPMEEGTLAMARASYSYDSASSQFFIVTAENEQTEALYGDYAAFGKVIEGLDVVHKIEEVEVKAQEGEGQEYAEQSIPVNTVKINSIRVETNGIDYGMPNTILPQANDYSQLYDQLGIDPSSQVLSE